MSDKPDPKRARRRRRPTKRDMPEPIPDTPEQIARALLTSPPREPDEWRYDTERDR